jgi:hypothetical protein
MLAMDFLRGALRLMDLCYAFPTRQRFSLFFDKITMHSAHTCCRVVYCEGAKSRLASHWWLHIFRAAIPFKICMRLAVMLSFAVKNICWDLNLEDFRSAGFPCVGSQDSAKSEVFSQKSLKLPEMRKSAKNVIIRICNNTMPHKSREKVLLM